MDSNRCRDFEHERNGRKFFTTAELWHEKGITEKPKMSFDKVRIHDAKSNNTSIHQFIINCSTVPFCRVCVWTSFAQRKLRSLQDGDDELTHMEVREKFTGVQKNLHLVLLSQYFPLLYRHQKNVYVCACVCVMCSCVFKSKPVWIFFQFTFFFSPLFAAPFKVWMSQWGDTAQVSIFPQETSVYISKWVQNSPALTANLSSWQSQH